MPSWWPPSTQHERATQSSEDWALRVHANRLWLFYAGVAYTVAVAFYFIAPLGSHWGNRLLGTAFWAPDNILNASILEWGWRSLRSPDLHVFEWVAGYPLENSLAGTENLLGWQVFYTPLRALGVGSVPAVNVLFCLSFLVAALGGAAFSKYLGIGVRGAFCAGFIFAFAPTHLLHMRQLQSMSVCWVPWALIFARRFVLYGTWRWGVIATTLCCMTMLSGMYVGIFLGLTLALWLGAQHAFKLMAISRSAVLRLLILAAASGMLLSPVFVKYARFDHKYGLIKSVPEMERNSMSLSAFFRPSPLLLSWKSETGGEGGQFAGITVFLLFAFGVWKAPMGPKWKWHLIAVCVVLWLLACGPFLRIESVEVHLYGYRIPLPGLFLRLLPGFRVPSRIMLSALLFFSTICGAGAEALSRLDMRKLAAVAVLLFAELYPERTLTQNGVELPAASAMAQAYNHLSGCPVSVELPVEQSPAMAELLSRYVYGAAGHLHRVVSYYASTLPREVMILQRVAGQLPDVRARAALLASGVNCVILHNVKRQEDYDALLVEFRRGQYSVSFAGTDSAVILLGGTETPR